MRTASVVVAAVLLFGLVGLAWGPRPLTAEESGNAAAAADTTEDWGGLAPGPGREEVYYLCAGCHSLAIVKQQRLSRESWEETLHWMIEEQGMAEPEPEEWSLVLDYLDSQLGLGASR